jgi:hypothetical protein
MTPSLTQAQVQAALRAFLLGILPQGVEVLIGQENRVPEPSSDNFVIMWGTLRKRLGTNVTSWDQTPGANPTTQDNTEPMRLDMQLDFHGADSTDNAQVFAALFRSSYACQFFGSFGFSPDYCSDGQQMPFINGEQQYEDRWTLSATFDANITVSTPQQFANEVNVIAVSAEQFADSLLFDGTGPIFFRGEDGGLSFYGS